jgi:hypothetical protein
LLLWIPWSSCHSCSSLLFAWWSPLLFIVRMFSSLLFFNPVKVITMMAYAYSIQALKYGYLYFTCAILTRLRYDRRCEETVIAIFNLQV